MNKSLIITIFLVILVLVMINVFHTGEPENLNLLKLKQEYVQPDVVSVDHSTFPELQKTFNSPQDVTETCISCHTERHTEIMESAHWNWERVAYVEGRGITKLGKKNVLNNFCIGASGNEQSCAKCHIGFGMNNDQFDFENARNVDCMVCHDNSEEYMKGSATAGYPDRNVNLTKVAQSVGSPQKENCGFCHFNSGGGNNVKHGDLEQALLAADREVDIHMGANGMDMSCVDCHTAENHQIKGRLYSVSSENTNRAFCEDCHGNLPHFDNILNRHTSKVACQTCHIPEYAKVNATKMAWYWSEAGNLKDGEPYSIDNEDGNHEYLSTKGRFVWEKNVKPDYVWFNGKADHYVLGDSIKSIPVEMNTLYGSHDDPDSKIVPVKIHVGDQIYDKKNNILIQPKLFAEEAGDSAYWKDFDWGLAAEAGMERVGLPYSGEYGFVKTKMYWPVNHMVATKENSVQCAECHTQSEDGRLASLEGFYLPGRDHSSVLDFIGRLDVLLALLGVFIHGSIRVFLVLRKRKYSVQTINEKV
ncbi:MAG: tetrathionate reductase family octaheme c-type cytochrome [Ignavibacteriae bacterium]|nr:tetrathionate reductase family octaheme c-type cytochrome [Ignavibacteriota bacterium]NOG98973.1 tetrathionate reductase family octaheme c-type cytochrome [Ignavibacteriota bacterium]